MYEYSQTKVNENRLPLLVIYNEDESQVLLQLLDLYLFFEKDEITTDDIEALLLKTGIFTDPSKVTSTAKDIAEKLPVVSDNLEVNEDEIEIKQHEIGVFDSKP